MKKIAILQARNNSFRFPKKIMSEVNGINILTYCIKKIKMSKKIDQLIIATTNKKIDDEIIKTAQNENISYFRGSENDVLQRFYKTAKKYDGEIIIRLNSDNPLIDPEIIDNAIQILEQNTKLDYVTTILSETFPLGMHVEVLRFNVLKWLEHNVDSKLYREHVTPYIYNNPQKFKIFSIVNNEKLQNYRLTIDYPEDLVLFKEIIKHCAGKWEALNLRKIINIFELNPEIKKINNHLLRAQSFKLKNK